MFIFRKTNRHKNRAQTGTQKGVQKDCRSLAAAVPLTAGLTGAHCNGGPPRDVYKRQS